MSGRPRPATECARPCQVSLYEYRNNCDRSIFSVKSANAIFRRERRLVLAAAIQHAPRSHPLIAARGIARCLTNKALAISEAERLVVLGLKLKPDTLKRQVRLAGTS